MPEQRWIRSSLVWIVLIVAILAMWATFVGNDNAPTPRSIGQVAQEIRDGKVQKLVQQDKIFAALGSIGTPTAMAAMPIYLDAKVAHLFPLSGAREM